MHDAPETRASLILRLQGHRDEAAWYEFVEIYEPMIYRLARRRGLQHQDAVEVVQEVLSRVAGAIGKWEIDPARGQLRGWLFRITRNYIIQWLRGKDRRPTASGDTGMQALVELQPDPSWQESGEFRVEFERQLFRWAAGRAEPEFRANTWQAFWRTAVDQQPIDQVAAELNMTPGAVYIARCRVMARLKQLVAEAMADSQ